MNTQLRSFTSTDYDAYAGATPLPGGDEPLIANVGDWTVIVSGDERTELGVSVQLIGPFDEVLDKEFSSITKARAFVEGCTPADVRERMHDEGFLVISESMHDGVRFAAFDSRDMSARGYDTFKETFADLGLCVYDDPRFEGSDVYGFIISKTALTPQQIAAVVDLA